MHVELRLCLSKKFEIEANVERYLPHTSDDDDTRYRPRQEIEEARKRDPVKILAEQLRQVGILTDDLDEEIRGEARQVVDRATDEVDSAPYPGTEDFYQHVYAP